MKINTTLIVTLAASFIAIAGLIVLLVVTGHDPTVFVSSLLSLIPVVAGIIALGAKQSKTDNDVATIKTNTNGTLSNLTSLVTKAIGALPPDTAQQIIADHVASGGTLPTGVTDVVTTPTESPTP